ncbi:MAG: hypothetical protein GX558_03130, partial [Clostridiales bacterium]|nr:hypothetical protein [Clostridiales bacterium]
HNSYLRGDTFRFDTTMGADDWTVVYDATQLSDAVMTKGDIDRMLEEEVIKFISGVRKMDEWDSFINDLYAIGLDDLIDARTEQYNAQMSAK